MTLAQSLAQKLGQRIAVRGTIGAAASEPTAPAAITDLVATAGDTEVVLTWTAPDNGGSAITDYVVEYRATGDPDWIVFADGTSSSTGATVTGLANDTGYDFQVSAVNAVGTGDASNVATATPYTALDAPLYAAIDSKGYLAFGFDRLVHDYAGNTARLKRLSDNAESDFSIGANGTFDLAAVDTWRSTADVDVVKFYDQMGGVKELAAVGTVAFIRTDAVKRFGTTWSSSDGQLTRSATNGGVGCDLGDDVGCFRLLNCGINFSDGASAFDEGKEVHLLYSHNERKGTTANIANDPPALGANGDSEWVFTWGTNTNERFVYAVDSASVNRIRTGSPTDTDASDGVSSTLFHKKFAQSVQSIAIESNAFKQYAYGRENLSAALTGNAGENATRLANGTFDNKHIVFGNTFTNTSTSDLRTSQRANVLFGGMIITAPLTAAERYFMQSKLSQVGQQHRIKPAADISAYFDEIVLFKDADSGTGIVTGENAEISLQLKTDGSSSWEYAYADPAYGPAALHCSTEHVDNVFTESNGYFADAISGTVISVNRLDEGLANPNEVRTDFIIGTGTVFSQGTQNVNWSMGVGYDHGTPTFSCKFAASRDDDGVTGTRHMADDTQWGANYYDDGNQAQGKYNRNTSLTKFVFDEVIDVDGNDYTMDEDNWQNGAGSTLPHGGMDGPVYPPCADNLRYPWKQGPMLTHIITFEAPVGYSKADAYATRKAARLQSVNKLRVQAGALPVGHQDGDIAINNYACVHDADATARIMQHNFQYPFKGSRWLWAFSANVLTDTQIEEVNTNLYKLLEA